MRKILLRERGSRIPDTRVASVIMNFRGGICVIP